MKHGFIIKDGKALIIDEDGTEKEWTPNYENLKEILETEDMIEELEHIKKELINSIENNKQMKIPRKKYLSLFFFGFVVIMLFFNATTFFIEYKNIAEFLYELKRTNLYGLILSIGMGSFFCFFVTSENKIKNSHLKGEEEKLEFINKELTKAKQHLEKLKQNKKVTTSEKITYTKLNTKEKLKELKSILENYYFAARYEKELLKLYQKDALSKKCDEEEIKFITEYFEEKGIPLKKKRK